MFDHFITRPFHLALHREGPFADERRRFLEHLRQEGRAFLTLKHATSLLLSMAQLLTLGQSVHTPFVIRQRPTCSDLASISILSAIGSVMCPSTRPISMSRSIWRRRRRCLPSAIHSNPRSAAVGAGGTIHP